MKGGGVRSIKGRIRAVSGIQQITRAMKLVAAVRIKKADVRMKAFGPIAAKMQEVINDLVSQMDEVVHPLMACPQGVKDCGILVITSDKGLCGSYNHNVLREAESYIYSLPPERSIRLITVGQKARKFFLKQNVAVEKALDGWKASYEEAHDLAYRVIDWFISGEVEEVRCFYTRPASAMVQKALSETILPLQGATEKKRPLPYLFEPPPPVALKVLLPRYVEVVLLRILLESRAAELGARLKAMTNATENAEKYVKDLTLAYFRARQDAITTEIIEVASGANYAAG